MAEVADRHQLFPLVAAGDRRGAVDWAHDALDLGVPVADLVVDVIAPVQAEVGRRWQAADWTVADEHAASAVVDAVLATLPVPPPSPGRPRVVVVCAEADWHVLPARMVSEVLASQGCDVRFLGPSVPARDLLRFLERQPVDAVALSCATPTDLPGAHRSISAAAAAGVPVVVGGGGVGADPVLAARLGAAACAPDPRHVLALLDGLAAVSPAGAAPVHPQRAFAVEVHRPDLVRDVAARLATRPRGEGASSLQEAVGYALDAVRAAVFVDSPEILDQERRWLRSFLSARHPAATLADDVVEAVCRAAAGVLQDAAPILRLL